MKVDPIKILSRHGIKVVYTTFKKKILSEGSHILVTLSRLLMLQIMNLKREW